MSQTFSQSASTPKIERLVWVLFAVGFLVFILATAWALLRSGLFAEKETVNLFSDHADGLSVGMNVEFNGFPIGRVHKFSLREDGNVTVSLAIDAAQMRWLNGSTRFELQTPLIAIGGGGSKIIIVRDSTDSTPFSHDTIHHLVRPSFMAELNQRIEALWPKIEEFINRLSDDEREGSIQGILASAESTLTKFNTTLKRLNEHATPMEFLLGAQAEKSVQEILLETRDLVADVRAKIISGQEGSVVQLLSTADQAIAALIPTLHNLRDLSGSLAAESPRIGDILSETEESIIQVRLRLNELLNKLGGGPAEPIPLP